MNTAQCTGRTFEVTELPLPANLTNSQFSKNQRHTILIVEDSLPERARVVAILAKLGFKILEASDGAEALNILDRYSVSVVVTDWHMPIMNGLELCKTLNKEVKNKPYTLLLTGRNAKCDLVSGMDGGADDYLVKPFDSEELRVRIQSGIRIVDMQARLQEQNDRLQSSLKRENQLNQMIQKDLKAAARLQRSTLPDANQIINNVRCAHFFKPASGVAGDSFSVIPLGNKHVAFYQIDVVGHGIRSAMLSYAITRFLHEHAKHPPTHKNSVQMQNPAKVLYRLNREFACNEDCDDYFTMVYGVLNTQTGTGNIAQAGHPHPIVVNKNGTVNRLSSGGVPIGLFSESQYINQSFELELGSRLYIYSDGIYECRADNNKALNDLAIEQILQNFTEVAHDRLQKHIDNLFRKLNDYHKVSDDISLLAIERQQPH